MKLREMIFGPRLPPADPDAEAQELQDALVKHKATLDTVSEVLSDSQLAVIAAIDDTAEAIERRRRARR